MQKRRFISLTSPSGLRLSDRAVNHYVANAVHGSDGKQEKVGLSGKQ